MAPVAQVSIVSQPIGESIVTNPQTEILDRNLTDTGEVKQPIQYHEVDESLSEWEAARLTSKTWSMEQE